MKSKRQFKKKIVLTIIAAVLLVGCYYMIFMFSADNAEESSNLSQKVTKMLVKLYYRLTGGGSGQAAGVVPLADDALEGMIRKLAHFTEYMMVGFLSYMIAAMWMQRRRIGFMIVVIQLVISAAFDEFHQYFVPGRYASVKDVLIDTAGGIAGILFMIGISWSIKKISIKKSTATV